jgi:hypothetical protein
MAKKHASNAGFLIPEVNSHAPPPPPLQLPFNIGTLLLPKLIHEIARGKHINEAQRAAAHLAFKNWIKSLIADSRNPAGKSGVWEIRCRFIFLTSR